MSNVQWQYCNDHVTAGQRRVLMSKWAGEVLVYREQLEAEREECERKLKGERSRFYIKAFLRTVDACMPW